MNLVVTGVKRVFALALAIAVLASCLVTGVAASDAPDIYDSIYTYIAKECYNDSGVESEILKSGALVGGGKYETSQPYGDLISIEGNRLVVKRYPVFGNDGRARSIWDPKTCAVNGTSVPLRESPDDYQVYISEPLSITGAIHVEVRYEMDTGIAAELLNLPAILAEEAADQMTVLNRLVAGDEPYMGYMAQMTTGQLSTMYELLNPTSTFISLNSDADKNVAVKESFREVILEMQNNCFEKNGFLRFYQLLRMYQARGLIYYYEKSSLFLAEIDLFSQYMDALLNAEDRIVNGKSVHLTEGDKQSAIELLVEKASNFGFVSSDTALDFVDMRNKTNTAKAMLTAPNAAIDVKSSNLKTLTEILQKKATAVKGNSMESVVEPYGDSLILTCTRTADLCRHVYTDDNDSDCNVCGAVREAGGSGSTGDSSGSGNTPGSGEGSGSGNTPGTGEGSGTGNTPGTGDGTGGVIGGGYYDSASLVGTADGLKDTLADAGSEENIRITSSIVMTEDISVNASVKITGADKLNTAGHVLVLNDVKASITADSPLNVASGVDGYVPVKEKNANTYTLTEVQHPKTGGETAGSKTETLNNTRYLFLDLDPIDGMTLSALHSSTAFSELTDYRVEFFIEGNNGSGLVKTADRLVVKAFNADGKCVAQISYVVIVMGDTNCNGKVNSSDAAVTKSISQGKESSVEVRMAADVNFSGTLDNPKINSSDVSFTMAKWFAWDLNKYVSNLK